LPKTILSQLRQNLSPKRQIVALSHRFTPLNLHSGLRSPNL
jgi:hypothetical protein